jgi:hypothetical protein
MRMGRIRTPLRRRFIFRQAMHLPEGPYFEAFNSPSVVNDWIGFNYDRNNSKWSYAANTGKGGNGCMKVELIQVATR